MVPACPRSHSRLQHCALLRRSFHGLRGDDCLRCVRALTIHFHWLHTHSPDFMRSGMVISQAKTGGFRFRTVDEIQATTKPKVTDSESFCDNDRKSTTPIEDKKVVEEFVESI